MINICTLSDRNFLAKGLALYQSLIEVGCNFRLHYLCLDKETYDILYKFRNLGITRYSLTDLMAQDKALFDAQYNPPSKYAADKREQFIWALTPYFTHYILKQLPDTQYLIYCDSDICLYDNPELLIDIVKPYSIGVHSHRFPGVYSEGRDTGWFNVGIVIFKNDSPGLNASYCWKNWLLNPNNEHYQKYGTCGDQKYLELFVKNWPNEVCIFDTNIQHLAPWNLDRFDQKEETFFYHFSDYKPGENRQGYSTHSNPEIEKYFKYYAYLLNKSNKLISHILANL